MSSTNKERGKKMRWLTITVFGLVCFMLMPLSVNAGVESSYTYNRSRSSSYEGTSAGSSYGSLGSARRQGRQAARQARKDGRQAARGARQGGREMARSSRVGFFSHDVTRTRSRTFSRTRNSGNCDAVKEQAPNLPNDAASIQGDELMGRFARAQKAGKEQAYLAKR